MAALVSELRSEQLGSSAGGQHPTTLPIFTF